MFLFYVILLMYFLNCIETIHSKNGDVPTVEEMYPLKRNEEIQKIAAQFEVDPEWEHGGQAMPNNEHEEMKGENSEPYEYPRKLGNFKVGHIYHTNNMHAYRINSTGVHPDTLHHVFFVRHG